MKRILSVVLALALLMSCVTLAVGAAESETAAVSADAAAINTFLNSATDPDHYNVYDGSNENNFFMMSGRKYTQGFTLTSDDGWYKPQVTFNVQNIDTIEMTIGHLDDRWQGDVTMNVYRDGEWWFDIPLEEHGSLMTQTFKVNGNSTLRLYFGGRAMYGFGDIKIDGKTSIAPTVPEYDSVNAFMNAGYDIDHYTVYDDANENTTFSMGGRKYTQGFTLTSDDGWYKPQITFNVENVNTIEMTIGHLDDQWQGDVTMNVYRDGKWWFDLELKENGELITQTFKVSDNSTLRFYIGGRAMYGFGDIKIDGMTSSAPSIPQYDTVNAFMEAGYDLSCYNKYDDSNDNNYFSMNGRKYTQGFTLTSDDSWYKPQVTFNVENVDTIEMTIGHLDDRWQGDVTMNVYRDGKWWFDLELKENGKLITQTFKVTDNSTLRFYIGGRAMYGFGDIKIGGMASSAPVIPEYDAVNTFIEAGYDLSCYDKYDGSNENKYFSMSGRKYTQGFTLTSDDSWYKPQVTFNVENVNSIEMTIGHLDDRWQGDVTLNVYHDGEWWQDIELFVHNKPITQVFDVAPYSTLRFYIDGRAMYGFGDIKIDGKTSTAPIIPAYKDASAFIDAGYDVSNCEKYDGSNEYNYFTISGRQYSQGFTLASDDGWYKPEVSFNVENLDRIRFGVGHLDDQGGSDQELIIYKDGAEYYRAPLKVDGGVSYYTLRLKKTTTLRFYIAPHCAYGFADITFDNHTAAGKDSSDYIDIDKANGVDPDAEEPDTDEPGTDEPGTDEPGTDEPGTYEPGTDEPGTDEPGTDEPGTDEPGTDEPGTYEPGTDEPGTDEPGTDEPGIDEPGTDEPVGVLIKADGNSYAVNAGDVFTYRFYLSTGERLCSLDAETFYDTDGLALESDTSDLEAIFPIIGDSMILNSMKAGRLKYNFSSANGKKFDSDNRVLIELTFTVTAETGVYEINTFPHTVAGANEHLYTFGDEVLDPLQKAESELEDADGSPIPVYTGEIPQDPEPSDEPGTDEPGTDEPGTDEPAGEPDEEPVLIGDVNLDGVVNNRDAVILDRYIAGWLNYEKQVKSRNAADLSRDGELNNRDTILLDRYVAGWSGYERYIHIS